MAMTPDKETPAAAGVAAAQSGGAGSTQTLKSAIDFAPLVAFILAYALGGLYWATGALMISMAIVLPAAYLVLGHVTGTQLVTAVLVWVFGALTFWFHDTTFIKLKPTVFNIALAAFLVGGAMLGKPVLKLLFGEVFKLTDQGWRILTWRWVGFFLALALLNEIIRRLGSDTLWANFKVFGILGLTIAFSVAQIGLLKRHEPPSD